MIVSPDTDTTARDEMNTYENGMSTEERLTSRWCPDRCRWLRRTFFRSGWRYSPGQMEMPGTYTRRWPRDAGVFVFVDICKSLTWVQVTGVLAFPTHGGYI